MKTTKTPKDKGSTAPRPRRKKDELTDQDLDKVAGGVRTGDDDDMDDTEVQRLR